MFNLELEKLLLFKIHSADNALFGDFKAAVDALGVEQVAAKSALDNASFGVQFFCANRAQALFVGGSVQFGFRKKILSIGPFIVKK